MAEENLEKEAPGSKSLMEVDDAELVLASLEKSMTEDFLYQDASLSLRTLAEHLNIHSNKLSWLINEKIGQNFNEYLNSLRLEDFKVRVLNPKNAHITILGLAYESGFNSKSVFNTFFKKQTGMTPRAWVKLNKK